MANKYVSPKSKSISVRITGVDDVVRLFKSKHKDVAYLGSIINTKVKKAIEQLARTAIEEEIDKKFRTKRTAERLKKSMTYQFTNTGSMIARSNDPGAPFFELGYNPWGIAYGSAGKGKNFVLSDKYISSPSGKMLKIHKDELSLDFFAGPARRKARAQSYYVRDRREALRSEAEHQSRVHRGNVFALRNSMKHLDKMRKKYTENKKSKTREQNLITAKTTFEDILDKAKRSKQTWLDAKAAYVSHKKMYDLRKYRVPVAGASFLKRMKRIDDQGYAYFPYVRIAHKPFIKPGLDRAFRDGVIISVDKGDMKINKRVGGGSDKLPIALDLRFGLFKIKAVKNG